MLSAGLVAGMVSPAFAAQTGLYVGGNYYSTAYLGTLSVAQRAQILTDTNAAPTTSFAVVNDKYAQFNEYTGLPSLKDNADSVVPAQVVDKATGNTVDSKDGTVITEGPATVSSVSAINGTTVEVTFSKALDAAPAATAFTFDNGLTASVVALKAGTTATYTVTTSAQDSTKQYTLSYNGAAFATKFTGFDASAAFTVASATTISATTVDVNVTNAIAANAVNTKWTVTGKTTTFATRTVTAAEVVSPSKIRLTLSDLTPALPPTTAGVANYTISYQEIGATAMTVDLIGYATAPTFTVTPVDSTHLTVVFSDKVAKAGAETEGNYSLAYPANTAHASNYALGAGDSAVLAADGKTLNVTLANAMVSGQYYFSVDTAAAVTDLAGNAIASGSSAGFMGLSTTDSVKPTVSMVTYDSVNKTLDVKFSEVVTLTNLVPASFVITDGTTNVALDADDTAAVANEVITFTLTAAKAAQVAALTGNLTLNIAASAVQDAATVPNKILVSNGNAVTNPPALLETSAYSETTGILTLKFNKDIDVSTLSAADLASITMDINGTSTAVTGATKLTSANGSEIQLQLTQTLKDAIQAATVTTSTVTVTAAGLVSDLGGNTNAVNTAKVLLYTEDNTKPALQTAAYNSLTNQLTLVFNTPVDKDGSSLAGAAAAIAYTNLKFTDGTATYTVANGATVATQLTKDEATVVIQLEGTVDAVGVEALDTTKLKLYYGASTFTSTNGVVDLAVSLANAKTVSVADVTPPTVVSATVVNGTTIDVLFSEDVNKTIAETKTNYVISATTNPAVTLEVVSAQLLADKKTLRLTTAAQAAINYTIAYGDTIADTTGNVILAAASSTFNGSATSDTTPPYLHAVTAVVATDKDGDKAFSAGDTIDIAFTEPININGLTDASFAGTADLGTSPSFALVGAETLRITLGTTPTIAADGTDTIGLASTSVTGLTDNSGNAGSNAVNATRFVPRFDTVAPTLASMSYQDTNLDGDVSAGDKLVLTFSENLKAGTTFTQADFTTSDTTSLGTFTQLTTTAKTYTVTLGGAPTFVPNSTRVDVLFAGTANVQDAASNNGAASATKAIVLADATAPTITSVVYADVDADGTVNATDTLTVTLSEPIAVTAAASVVANATKFRLSDGTTVSDFANNLTSIGEGGAGAYNKVTLTLSGAETITLGTTKLVYDDTRDTTKSVRDAAQNKLASTGAAGIAITVTDATAPYIVSAAHIDTNSDGVVDNAEVIRLTLSEEALGTLTANDFVLTGGASVAGFTFEAVAAGQTTYDLTAVASSNITPETTKINIVPEGSIRLKDNYQNKVVASDAAVLIDDTTAPISTVPALTGAATNDVDSLVITFSQGLLDSTTGVEFVDGEITVATYFDGANVAKVTSATYAAAGNTLTLVLAGVADTNVFSSKGNFKDVAGNTYVDQKWTYAAGGTIWTQAAK